MFLNFIALITAISISGVAAYYSIVGLTAIFSGVLIPIIIMGTVLEVGKIVTTVWLHVNWQKMGWTIRSYLSTAVVVLMFITSMGIFGFLSRAHIDATSSVGDNQLIIEQLDQQIAVERQRITDSQRVIAQMDTAINNILNQSSNARTVENQRGGQIANQASNMRNQQKKERDALNKTIDDTNKRIAEISQQKLKLQQSQAKTEAEVGPIKYIAQLIYGDQINKDLLERAVRWVIIIIVAVFDPLAVCLILAVTMSMTHARRERNGQENSGTKGVEEDRRDSSREQATGEGSDLTEGTSGSSAPQPPIIQYVDRPIIEYKTIEVEKIIEKEIPVEVIRTIEIEKPVEVIKEVEKIVEVPVEVIKEVEKIVEVQVEDHARMLELAAAIDNLLGEMKNKDHQIGKLRAQIEILEHPEDFIINDSVFGKALPKEAPVGTGQLFVRMDPSGLSIHKWNGYSWIQVDKEQNSSYLLDDPVTDGIITSLATGELAWEALTSKEQDAIEPLLKDDFKLGRR
jgi:hypothetical protein